MNVSRLNAFVFFLMVIFVSGCATKVSRVDVDQKIDLSGQWNDYDALETAKEMVTDSVSKPWHKNFIDQKARLPIVIVGPFTNRSHEHIDSDIMTDYLERELLNSGKVIFVASAEERKAIREERNEQHQGMTAEETIKKIGREKGADYMLIGSVNTVKDEVKGQYVILYQTNFELVDLETNEKTWIGQKQIKKRVKKSGLSL